MAISLASCGEPAAPGLGSVSINNGETIEYEFTSTPTGGGTTCNMVGAALYIQLIVSKEDADLGQIEFGSDTVLDNFGGAPNVEPVTNALVTIFGIDSDLVVQHSTSSLANFFIDPGLVLGTQTGSALVRTGDDGVSYLVISVDPINGTDAFGVDFSAVPTGSSFTRQVAVVPSSPSGEGMEVIMTFSCN
ncbi:MAG: hypothetical protein KDH09_00060 [Chrysiogenetes bacterium]|nr:hypothetical protein [Chrysiogenetes bacterium]